MIAADNSKSRALVIAGILLLLGGAFAAWMQMVIYGSWAKWLVIGGRAAAAAGAVLLVAGLFFYARTRSRYQPRP
jgi:hypothetical protein